MNAKPRAVVRPVMLLALNGALMICMMWQMTERVLGLSAPGDAVARLILSGGICAFIGAAVSCALLQDTRYSKPSRR